MRGGKNTGENRGNALNECVWEGGREQGKNSYGAHSKSFPLKTEGKM